MITIRDVRADVIPACFTFDCCGFEVSCSTILKPYEIVVFRRSQNDGAMYRATSVEDAVDWCRANTDKL